jgi:2-octaprenylphenol hydroxylase
MTECDDVLVVGGGVVGLSAALAMGQRGYSVAVIDTGELKVDSTVPDARVYAVNHTSQELFKELGVWDELEPKRVAPYQKMYVWDAVNRAHIEFDARTVAEPYLGCIIEESVLKKALLTSVTAHPKIRLFARHCVEEIEEQVEFIVVRSAKQQWQGQLLMIADGANSPSRTKLGVRLTSWSYNQQALVATVTTELPHQHTAYQVFHPDGPLAFLPLVDAHQCSIVWSTEPSRVEELMRLSDEAFNGELERAFASKLGSVTLSGARHSFPLRMRHVQQYCGKRWVLLGDAAHTIHPLAGLGLNVGLSDVRAWLRLLDKAPQKIWSSKHLSAYQRERKHAVWQTILLMEGLKRFFGYKVAPISTLRGLGIRLSNQITPLKRLFIEHAAGR